VQKLGVGAVHKFRKGAVADQLTAASFHTGWPTRRVGEPSFEEIAFGAGHDRLDAYLAAWVASLDESERTAYGTPPDDAIWIPRLGVVGAFAYECPPIGTPEQSRPSEPSTTSARRESTAHSLRCPACGVHEFVRWPWGWDAHAAHTCAGLAASDPSERKREYRRRFAGHFTR
jgi:hypothetical protein